MLHTNQIRNRDADRQALAEAAERYLRQGNEIQTLGTTKPTQFNPLRTYCPPQPAEIHPTILAERGRCAAKRKALAPVIRDLAQQMESVREIARKARVSPGTVRKVADEYEIALPKHPQGFRK